MSMVLVAKSNLITLANNSWLNLNSGSGTAPPAGMIAYGGFAIDTTNRKIRLWGGGHNDYWGNDAWTLDIATGIWTKDYISDYTSAIHTDYVATGHAIGQAHTDLATYDGMWLDNNVTPTVFRPIGRHTYGTNAWMPNVDNMIVGGSAYNGGPDSEFLDCWSGADRRVCMYDPITKVWTFSAVDTVGIGQGAYGSVASLYYYVNVSVADHVRILTYDGIGTRAVLSISGQPDLTAVDDIGITYDPSRNCLYILFWVGASSTFWKVDLSASPALFSELTITNGPTQNAVSKISYDSANDVVIAMIPSNSSPPIIKVYSCTGDSWSTPTPPATKPGWGENTIGSCLWHYDPINNVHFYLTCGPTIYSSAVSVWAYRYSS